MFIWYAITFLTSFDISFDFEMERKTKKSLSYFKKEKKKKLIRVTGYRTRTIRSTSQPLCYRDTLVTWAQTDFAY